MAQYDPQRSRSRQRAADEEGPAPVDALLGSVEASGNGSGGEGAGGTGADPVPGSPDDATGVSSQEAAGERRGPVVVDVGPTSSTELPDTTRRVTAVRIAMLLGALLGVAALIGWWRRRRGRAGA